MKLPFQPKEELLEKQPFVPKEEFKIPQVSVKPELPSFVGKPISKWDIARETIKGLPAAVPKGIEAFFKGAGKGVAKTTIGLGNLFLNLFPTEQKRAGRETAKYFSKQLQPTLEETPGYVFENIGEIAIGSGLTRAALAKVPSISKFASSYPKIFDVLSFGTTGTALGQIKNVEFDASYKERLKQAAIDFGSWTAWGAVGGVPAKAFYKYLPAYFTIGYLSSVLEGRSQKDSLVAGLSSSAIGGLLKIANIPRKTQDILKQQSNKVLKKYNIKTEADWKRAMHKYHPDVSKLPEKQAAKIAAQINAAWSVKTKTPQELQRGLMQEFQDLFRSIKNPSVPGARAIVPTVAGVKPQFIKPTVPFTPKPTPKPTPKIPSVAQKRGIEAIKPEKGVGIPKAEKPAEKAIPKELELLAREARKYKGAEEFIREIDKGLPVPVSKGVPKSRLHEEYVKKGLRLKQLAKELVEREYEKRYPPITQKEIDEEIRRLYEAKRKAGVLWAQKPFNPKSKTIRSKLTDVAITNLMIKRPLVAEARNDILKDFYNQAIKEVKPTVEEISPKIVQNIEYKKVKNKLEAQGSDSLTDEELKILSNGPAETITAEGVKPALEEDIAADKIMELFSGLPLERLKDIPITFRGTKMRLIDALGKEIIRYYGLAPETKRLLVQLEGGNDVRKEELIRLFKEQFPISSEQAKLLNYHQENPEKYPIPAELKPYADKVESLIALSQKLQEERGTKEFFPQSFINRANKEIQRHQSVISTLKEESAINKHRQAIKDLQDYIEFLEGLRYSPHLYLFSEEIQRNILRLMPEGRITSKFRDTLTKLKGRRIATLDDAKELGLFPEEDIRITLAAHFEYLFRKITIHDIVEELKKNSRAVLSEDKAPDDWDKVAISQLDGYRIHPLLTAAIEDLGTSYETGIIGKGYDAINYLGKAIVFYNPIILPFWDIFQAYAVGSIRPWRPVYSAKLVAQAWKEVLRKGELYKELVKRELYRTPRVGYYSPPIENTMRVIVNQMEKDYPGWKKAVSKITGKPVDWKTYTFFPDLYTTNWRLTWFLDRVLRTATVKHLLNKGFTLDEAAEHANTFHANYNLFTKKSKKWLNRAFLVPTYKANMIVNMPAYVAKNTFKLAKNIVEGQPPTPAQKASFGALWRIAILVAGTLAFAAWRGYYLREGYRLVKKLDEPEITKEGKVLTERVITLPGPFAEIPKLVARIKRGPEGLYMYMAKVPQITWGLSRNARWNGDPYYDEGAAPEIQRRQIMIGLLRDYVAPIDRIGMMTDEESGAIDNILSTFGIATYKRGGTERRIFYQIQKAKSKLNKYLKRPDISVEDKKKAIKHFQQSAEKWIDELEDYAKTYK